MTPDVINSCTKCKDTTCSSIDICPMLTRKRGCKHIMAVSYHEVFYISSAGAQIDVGGFLFFIQERFSGSRNIVKPCE